MLLGRSFRLEFGCLVWGNLFGQRGWGSQQALEVLVRAWSKRMGLPVCVGLGFGVWIWATGYSDTSIHLRTNTSSSTIQHYIKTTTSSTQHYFDTDTPSTQYTFITTQLQHQYISSTTTHLPGPTHKHTQSSTHQQQQAASSKHQGLIGFESGMDMNMDIDMETRILR